MKRIVKFGFQALKDTVDLTVLGKSTCKTANIATAKKIISDSSCFSLGSTAKRLKPNMPTQQQILLLNLLI